MKSKFEVTKWMMFAVLGAMIGSTAAQAQRQEGEINFGFARCGSLGDSLDTTQAEGRLKWAKRYYSANLYWAFAYRQNYIDPRSQKRVALYPTYGQFTGAVNPEDGTFVMKNPQNYFAPTADSEIPPNEKERLPPDYELVAMCIPSCFAPDTEIAVSSDFAASIASISSRKDQEILTPRAGIDFSEIGNVGSFKSTKVTRFIKDYLVADPLPQPIVNLSFRSGGKLEITPEHSVLVADGTMKKAKDVAIGDLFVKADGSFDEVTSAIQEQKRTRVYNMVMDSSLPEENLVVSNGYLTGSYFFQAKDTEIINRQIFRNSVPEALVGQL